jgi:hypothetical protein
VELALAHYLGVQDVRPPRSLSLHPAPFKAGRRPMLRGCLTLDADACLGTVSRHKPTGSRDI